MSVCIKLLKLSCNWIANVPKVQAYHYIPRCILWVQTQVPRLNKKICHPCFVSICTGNACVCVQYNSPDIFNYISFLWDKTQWLCLMIIILTGTFWQSVLVNRIDLTSHYWIVQSDLSKAARSYFSYLPLLWGFPLHLPLPEPFQTSLATAGTHALCGQVFVLVAVSLKLATMLSTYRCLINTCFLSKRSSKFKDIKLMKTT